MEAWNRARFKLFPSYAGHLFRHAEALALQSSVSLEE